MKLIAVTNRRLCRDHEDFLHRIAILAEELEEEDRILLREKDLPPQEYTTLAAKCLSLCRHTKAQFLLHSHPETALILGQTHLHVPLSSLMKKSSKFKYSTSIHSAEEAKLAQQLGAEFLIAGHIFPTACKAGLMPRGLDFLRSVCETVTIPVYAIGGITAQHVPDVLAQGAAGVCVMSHLMTCPDLKALLRKLKRNT